MSEYRRVRVGSILRVLPDLSQSWNPILRSGARVVVRQTAVHFDIQLVYLEGYRDYGYHLDRFALITSGRCPRAERHTNSPLSAVSLKDTADRSTAQGGNDDGR